MNNKTFGNGVMAGSLGILFLLSGLAGAETRTWTGLGGDTDWFNSENWDPDSHYPRDNDTIIIPSGASVLLTNETAALTAFSITNATLTFSNWTTRLRATSVTIENDAILTLPPAFTEVQMSNRGHIVCEDFLLESGGEIQSKGRGCQERNGLGKGTSGAWISGAGGGGHGGRGGIGAVAGGIVYGKFDNPTAPGSGGGSQWGDGRLGGHGGGAVRIEATGKVTIDGTINADGNNSQHADRAGGGSGGSVYITCQTFAGGGTGRISAEGGNAGTGGGGGGGGRIAIWRRVPASSRLAYLAGHDGGVIQLPEGDFPTFEGAVTADPGTGWRNLPDHPDEAAYPGTRYFYNGARQYVHVPVIGKGRLKVAVPSNA